jgi:hypothetical protein
MGTASREEVADFERLLSVVLNDPAVVPELVRSCPQLLTSVNNSSETVLHWLALENLPDGISLLHSLGASIPSYAVVHALQAGNVETVDLLLSLGGTFEHSVPREIVRNPTWGLTSVKQEQLLAVLEEHGY